jgi:hypothetical protein
MKPSQDGAKIETGLESRLRLLEAKFKNLEDYVDRINAYLEDRRLGNL